MTHRPLILLGSTILMALPSCDQKPSSPPTGENTASPGETLEPEIPPLIQQADRFGLAARLPLETPLYFGSVDLGEHIGALKASRYWRQVFAFIEDKTPAEAGPLPITADDIAETTIDDFALAMGPGSGPAVKQLMELEALYTELTYYTMMAGGSTSLLSGSPHAGDLLSDVMAMPGLFERLLEQAKTFEVPTLLVGLKMETSDDFLQSLKTYLQSDESLRQARVSNLTTPLGETLEIHEWQGESWITEDLLEELLEGVEEDQRANVESKLRQLDNLLTEKTLCLGFGKVADYAVAVIAPSRSAIEFVSDPSQSVLANPDLQALAEPVIAEKLAGLAVWSGDHIEQWIDRQPTKSILDGLMAGLKTSEVFGPLTDSITDEVSAFGQAEAAYHDRQYEDGAATFWWDQGLHVETIGGPLAEDMELSKPLEFAPLLDAKGLVFGVNGHDASDQRGRAYFETSMALLYGAAKQAVGAGLAGPSFMEMTQLIDTEIIQSIRQAYDASKTLYTKALDTESAFMIDLGGKMPMVWGMTEPPKGLPMLRLASVHDVKNRALISTSWLRIETALSNSMTKLPLPMNVGGVSDPIESKRFGITTYHQAPLFDSPDLLPCASLNDDLYILGTSKRLNEEIAFQINETADQHKPSGLRVRINFKNLRRLAEVAGGFSSEDAAATVDQSTKLWAAPFGLLDAHYTESNGRVKGRIDWEIRDLSTID